MKVNFKCEVCNISFIRKDKLKSHIKQRHKHLSEKECKEIFQRIRDIPLPSTRTFYEREIAESSKKLDS